MFLLLLACSGGKDSSPVDSTSSTDDSALTDDSSLTDDTGTASGERTLANCATDIDSAVPAFFQTYFKCATITVSGDTVTISTINLPPHKSPYYDESSVNYEVFDDQGGTHFKNPNQLEQQVLAMEFPMDPAAKGLTIDSELVDQSAGTSDEEYRSMGTLGINLDGVAMFHGVAAPGDQLSEEQYTFDTHEGHPQNTGVYHHHSANPPALAVLESIGLVTTTVPGQAEIELYGVMCDGTVLLGCTELDGSAPSGSVDAQGGHVHDITDGDGVTHFEGRYHTHICDGFYEYAPEIAYYNVQCN